MMYLMIFSFIYSGFYILFLLSEKRKKQTAVSRFKWVLLHRRALTVLAYLLFVSAGVMLMSLHSMSVGFVSWWIFSTPLLLLLILGHCHFKSDKK